MSLSLLVKLVNLFRPSHRYSSPAPKAQHLQTGQLGEKVALKHLKFEGYRIRALNYRVHNVGEIDIIGEEKGVICFVEVRTLKGDDNSDAFKTLDHSKRRRLTRTAAQYLRKHRLDEKEWRFDFASVKIRDDGIPRVELVRDAFPPER